MLSLIDTGGPGGAETVFLQTATQLDPKRFRSIPVISREGWLAEHVRANGVDPLIIPARGSFNLRYLHSLVGTIRRTRADVVTAHLYGSAIYGSLAGCICRVPVISVLHGQSDVEPIARAARLKAAVVRGGSSRVVFVSANLKNELAPQLGLPDSRCTVIPNGVDTRLFSPGHEFGLRTELGFPEDAIIVGAIGNIRPAKRYDVLLRAAQIVLQRSDRFYFVVAGELSGALATELLELRNRLGLEQRVKFLGLRSDVPQLLRNFDMYVLSSQTEGFSISCVEAMATAVPVVATRCGGPEEILAAGGGILVPAGSPEALAEALQQVVVAPGLRETLAADGLRRAREVFSLQRMLDRYERLLVDVTQTAPTRMHHSA